MSKLVSLAMIGLGGAGVTLVTPSSSRAQVPVGVQVGVGPVAVTGGTYVAPPVYPAYPYPVYARRVWYQPVYPVAPTVVFRSGFGWGPYRHYHHYHGRHR
jgi:hypothetical protein